MTVRWTPSAINYRKSLTKHQRRTLWLYKGIGMLKLGRMGRQTGENFMDPTAMLRERSQTSEFATFNNLVLTSTLGLLKPSRRWTWHSSVGKHQNQIDNILVRKPCQSGIKTHRRRSFCGSDHDLVMMPIQVHLKKAREP